MNSLDILNIISLALSPFFVLVYLYLSFQREKNFLYSRLAVQRRFFGVFFGLLYIETLILSSLFDVGSITGLAGIIVFTILILITYYLVDRNFLKKMREVDERRHEK